MLVERLQIWMNFRIKDFSEEYTIYQILRLQKERLGGGLGTTDYSNDRSKDSNDRSKEGFEESQKEERTEKILKRHYPNHCFQVACSTVTPAYPEFEKQYAYKEEAELFSNRACIIQYR